MGGRNIGCIEINCCRAGTFSRSRFWNRQEISSVSTVLLSFRFQHVRLWLCRGLTTPTFWYPLSVCSRTTRCEWRGRRGLPCWSWYDFCCWFLSFKREKTCLVLTTFRIRSFLATGRTHLVHLDIICWAVEPRTWSLRIFLRLRRPSKGSEASFLHFSRRLLACLTAFSVKPLDLESS